MFTFPLPKKDPMISLSLELGFLHFTCKKEIFLVTLKPLKSAQLIWTIWSFSKIFSYDQFRARLLYYFWTRKVIFPKGTNKYCFYLECTSFLQWNIQVYLFKVIANVVTFFYRKWFYNSNWSLDWSFILVKKL